MSDLFYIQNSGYCGNSLRWWRVDGGGYTSDLNQAWKVSREEAESICRSRPEEDYPRAVADMDAIAERHVDGQQLTDGGAIPKRKKAPRE